ncbi:calcineurin subunit B type 2 [Helianthus annuus]|uniref:calcineurin subunit B type 2 n=1 Tax=Helianthus annuus TaxID=4232 RepID=UPI000B903EB2|nr:calcineurin subunit B type 2 [Helianthus annuus]
MAKVLSEKAGFFPLSPWSLLLNLPQIHIYSKHYQPPKSHYELQSHHRTKPHRTNLHRTTTVRQPDEAFVPTIERTPLRLKGVCYITLTQYDIEDVQEHCNNLFSQQEIVSLYKRFCQLDRNAKGFISADEFLSVPEFAMNPLSQRLLKMVDGLNFKDFVIFLSAFNPKASMPQKIELDAVFIIYHEM